MSVPTHGVIPARTVDPRVDENDADEAVNDTARIDRMLAQDLLDALWLENFHGFRDQTHCADEAQGYATLVTSLADDTALHWCGTRLDGLRPLRLRKAGAAVFLQRAATRVPLSGAEALDALQHASWWPAPSQQLAELFALARHQMARTFAMQAAWLARLAVTPHSLSAWEAVCCLRDRPFHPLARAKRWPDAPGDAFDVESGRAVALHWVAIERAALLGGERTGPGDRTVLLDRADRTAQPIAAALLSAGDVARLAQRAQAAGVEPGALWMPVHPWQWQHLRRQCPDLLRRCIDLGGEVTDEVTDEDSAAIPTASLRTLSIGSGSDRPGAIHLKLSLSVEALGAERTLPPRYLHNGALAEHCLEALRARDAWLGAHLDLCGEREWWALGTPSPTAPLIDERGELACMIRRYPACDGWLLPMAACAAITSDARLPAFDALCAALAESGDGVPLDAAWRVFDRIARLLIEVGLRCFSYGVMPELHGQNVMLRLDAHGLRGLVLRDHDTLRICASMLAAAGVDAPAYVVDSRTPNTLMLAQPDALLAYFQTLAVEVNLYAIIAAIAECYDGDEATGWRIVGAALRDTVDVALSHAPVAQQCARASLFDAPHWPFKQLLAPLVAREAVGTGMPSGLGVIANPLRR